MRIGMKMIEALIEKFVEETSVPTPTNQEECKEVLTRMEEVGYVTRGEIKEYMEYLYENSAHN